MPDRTACGLRADDDIGLAVKAICAICWRAMPQRFAAGNSAGVRDPKLPERNARGVLEVCPERLHLIWTRIRCDVFAVGMASVDIPTACLSGDLSYTNSGSVSMLFDLALVFHPGYEAKFRDEGHHGVVSWPKRWMRNTSRGTEMKRDLRGRIGGANRRTIYRLRGTDSE